MKALKKILCTSLALASLSSLTVASTVVSADDELIYGTMNIPYADFYANEGVSSEVDAVSSATTDKWHNENLTAGTYNKANDDGTGIILGVTYNVALTQETLNALGSDNYGFTRSTETPLAYKMVTVTDGNVDFSSVIGDTSPVAGATASLSSSTPWGDYVIDVSAINNNQGTSDIGRIYGALLTTNNGDVYAMRHLQNIWRDELAWSSGFKTTEPHGSTLDYEDYVSLMGQTIDKVTYITETGYHIIDTDLYVPIKFNGTMAVENANVNAGFTTFTLTNLPADYKEEFSVENLNVEVGNDTINFNNAKPGSYTLKLTDKKGVYDSLSANFVLSTDETPVKANGKGIVVADGYTADDFANYIRNIATVTVDGNSYSASGRGAVSIIGEDGTVQFDAVARSRDGETPIFDSEKNEFEIVISSTGYENDVTFTAFRNEAPTEPSSDVPATEPISSPEQPTGATSSTNPTSATNPTNATSSTNPTSQSNTTNGNTTSNSSSSTTGKVATGDATNTVPMLLLVMLGGVLTAIALNKKKA